MSCVQGLSLSESCDQRSLGRELSASRLAQRLAVKLNGVEKPIIFAVVANRRA